MKMMKKFPIWCFAAAAFCACSSGEDTLPETQVPPTTTPAEKIPIRISTVMEDDIKRATDYAFEAGDRIGLFVVNRNGDGSAKPLLAAGNHVDNMGFTYSGTWTPDTPIY